MTRESGTSFWDLIPRVHELPFWAVLIVIVASLALSYGVSSVLIGAWVLYSLLGYWRDKKIGGDKPRLPAPPTPTQPSRDDLERDADRRFLAANGRRPPIYKPRNDFERDADRQFLAATGRNPYRRDAEEMFWEIASRRNLPPDLVALIDPEEAIQVLAEGLNAGMRPEDVRAMVEERLPEGPG